MELKKTPDTMARVTAYLIVYGIAHLMVCLTDTWTLITQIY